MSFLTDLLKDTNLTLAAQTAEQRHLSIEKARKNALASAIQKLTDFLVGTWLVKDLKASTALVVDMVKNGGLPEHAELFNRFFSEKPGSFFVYSFAEIWPNIGQAEKDLLVQVYYNRAKDFALIEGGDPTMFEWAVRGALGLLELSKADAKTADDQRIVVNIMKNFAEILLGKNEVLDAIADHNDAVVAKNATLSANEWPGKTCNVERLLMAVKETGVYRVNTEKFQSAAAAIKEKGDDRPAPAHNQAKHGQQKRNGGSSLPSRVYANNRPQAPKADGEAESAEVAEYRKSVPPATSSLADKMKAALSKEESAPVTEEAPATPVLTSAQLRRQKKNAAAQLNGIPPVPTEPSAQAAAQ